MAEHTQLPMTDGGTPGMTLRDWFAGQALATIIHLTQSREGGWDEVAVAAGAYAVADAMLAAREALRAVEGETGNG
jgi:hypothetical protein